jgi:hypothetical protein
MKSGATTGHDDANYAAPPRHVRSPQGTIAYLPHSDYTANHMLRFSPQNYFKRYKDTFD